jgi:hypothetical protein
MKCLEIIESFGAFVSCKCYKQNKYPNVTGIFVDGGTEHFRYGGNLANFRRLREQADGEGYKNK